MWEIAQSRRTILVALAAEEWQSQDIGPYRSRVDPIRQGLDIGAIAGMEGTMLSAEDNDLLTRTGADCAMGAYFRRFWQPVAFLDKPLTDFERREVEQRSPSQRKFFSIAYDMIRDRGPAHEIRDLSRVFATESGSCYLDFMHVGERPNDMIAEAMIPDVVARLR